jgi:hypothetical protein
MTFYLRHFVFVTKKLYVIENVIQEVKVHLMTIFATSQGPVEIWTVRVSTADSPCLTDSLATLGGQSGKLLPTKNPKQKGSNERRSRTREEHDEHPAEHYRGWSARGSRTVHQARRQ